MKKIAKKLVRTQRGQALPIVLILMGISGLILAPLLAYMSSGLKVGEAYERIADEFYAADAGIEDGLWHINHDCLDEVLTDYERYLYNYDYEYLPSHPLEVNDRDVDVTITNVWIPKDLDVPTLGEAQELIGAGKLIITGSVPAKPTQQIKIYYHKEPTDGPLVVNKIGIWLPPGTEYDLLGNNSLEDWLDASSQEYNREITTHAGGQAVVWTLTEPLFFVNLPGVDPMDTPMVSTFDFEFSLDDPESERTPEAVSWITTTGVGDIPYAWDADVRVFHINSEAEGTVIDAYAVRSEMREMGSAISGDYRAIGNTLMIDEDPWHYPPVRETLLDESDAVANDIPQNAQVDKAYLYWSAWIIIGGEQQTIFSDDCADINNGNWYYSYYSDWSDSWWGDAFQAHHYYYGNRELEMADSLELSEYESGSVTISWKHWLYDDNIESDDCLRYAMRNDSGWSGWYQVFCDDSYGQGSTWPQTYSAAVPDDYLTDSFRIKFRIDGFEGHNEIVYLDDIEVEVESETVADTEVSFKINGQPVYYADDEYGNPTVPTIGYQPIYADEVATVENEDTPQDDCSYCCRKEVTELLQTFTENGNAEYTVGDVDGTTHDQWSYAGWSLIIIYSSPETQRHQLYLFDLTTDNFKYIAAHGEGEKFSLSGFMVPDPIPDETIAAQITCFVGDGDDYYSGDFIALNAPDVDGDDIGNEYKLWDGITLSPPIYPPRLPNNASSPNNVWNSRSLGLAASGVDIDTFYIPWGDPPEDGLLKPGDTSATIVLNYADPNPYYAELINFIYIIISFRSRAVTGGTISYLIEG
jgi:hypothetical protein